ncbi:alpha/beta fold hydrolase [Cryptosporangium phraense]|uniref:Alpha/beta hydrolase n=1 Tax=Cryptosporangium phraense TaxID=2593070 RepID=A0A545AIG0_9ACTN|nr:alpha/beta hydrolase [Cryptosporangium phraense]TQS41103.1 alpha/beta hydrolase [Cryptosporangium phraense]
MTTGVDRLDPLDGFDYSTIEVGSSRYRVGRRGSGPAVLLLHGFPQTHYCWRSVAPALAGSRTVVVCDLKGYGTSEAAPGGPLGEGYSKREMARELVALMRSAGFARFAVVGHDRGARAGYRLALDHPDVVERLAVLSVIPTAEQFERLDPDAALDYWPFFFLAQPFAERVFAASADYLVRWILASWAGEPLPPDAVERYVAAYSPETIARVCAEYRAAFHLDRGHDLADRAAGRRLTCPVLVHWGAEEGTTSAGPLDVWRRWADDVSGGPLTAGHFLPEEAAEPLARSLTRFLAPPRPA